MTACWWLYQGAEAYWTMSKSSTVVTVWQSSPPEESSPEVKGEARRRRVVMRSCGVRIIIFRAGGLIGLQVCSNFYVCMRIEVENGEREKKFKKLSSLSWVQRRKYATE